MYLRSDEKELGKENFFAAVGSKPIRRDFLQKAARQGLTLRGGLGGYYFNYGKSLDKPLVVGMLGAGRQGCRLLARLTRPSSRSRRLPTFAPPVKSRPSSDSSAPPKARARNPQRTSSSKST